MDFTQGQQGRSHLGLCSREDDLDEALRHEEQVGPLWQSVTGHLRGRWGGGATLNLSNFWKENL